MGLKNIATKIGQPIKLKFRTRSNADIRLQGDGYYDSNWVLNIIENRILYKNRFFIPDPVNEFYCLLYHILIHKNELSDKYYDTLIRLASKIDLKLDSNILGNRCEMSNLLNIFLSKKRYKITNPKDFSVQYNYPGKGLKRIVWEKLGEIKNG